MVRERISIDARDDVILHSGADVSVYSDDHTTRKLHIDGATGAITQVVNTENIMLPTVLAVPIAYGTLTGTVATIGAGEIWFIHKVFVRTTTSFACTGDNCTLTIGDGNDADGFLTAADANLQSTFTEATGYPAGWYGIENGSNGAYTVDEGMFVYAPSAAETIDYAIGGTDPAAGAATIYVIYTRIL